MTSVSNNLVSLWGPGWSVCSCEWAGGQRRWPWLLCGPWVSGEVWDGSEESWQAWAERLAACTSGSQCHLKATFCGQPQSQSRPWTHGAWRWLSGRAWRQLVSGLHGTCTPWGPQSKAFGQWAAESPQCAGTKTEAHDPRCRLMGLRAAKAKFLVEIPGNLVFW